MRTPTRSAGSPGSPPAGPPRSRSTPTASPAPRHSAPTAWPASSGTPYPADRARYAPPSGNSSDRCSPPASPPFTTARSCSTNHSSPRSSSTSTARRRTSTSSTWTTRTLRRPRNPTPTGTVPPAPPHPRRARGGRRTPLFFAPEVGPARPVARGHGRVPRYLPGGMATTTRAPIDRVAERQRAVLLARHYREAEGLTIAQIAQRLGRSAATVKGYFYDPSGEKARAVKRRYQGACRGCGAPTQRAQRQERPPTSTARPATPEQSQPNGQPSGYAKQCAPGDTATAASPPHTTGHEPMPTDAAVNRSSDSRTGTGRPPASSPTCSAPGRPREQPPAPAHKPRKRSSAVIIPTLTAMSARSGQYSRSPPCPL